MTQTYTREQIKQLLEGPTKGVFPWADKAKLEGHAPGLARQLLKELDTHAATQAELQAAREENSKLRGALTHAVASYGAPSLPREASGDTRGWLARAQEALAYQPDTAGGDQCPSSL